MSEFASLRNRRILVSGADSGIGLAFARDAANAGAVLAALLYEDSDILDDVVDPSRRYTADLGIAAETDRAVAGAIGALEGKLDAVVVSAGMFLHKAALETGNDDWDRVLAVNLRGAFQIARRCGEIMRDAGGGSIVLVSSQIGAVGHPRAAAYAASKAGLNGLVKAMALELAPAGVRVNAVAPGPVATPMTAAALADPARAAALTAQIPLGRLGEPREIASAARFLVSDEAGFITGHILTADGGVTAA
ncbi:MAG: SDR family oxidoreductase [Pseudomonadota bacterium]